ncbi:MAG: nicotinate-nucleotide adenylyltransferase [Bacteroidales bacterium]|nr:nicotinate-nucleotide adenylyltransferase [Bacteroidales bacterium]
MKTKIGLFFGSFNPIHNGHLMLANYLAEYGGLDEIWFVVSPQNPFKDKKSLLADRHRMYMVEMAIKGDERFQVCDIEFYMPQPSYTIDTLTRLQERHPNTDFYLICGMDNIESFKKWKNYEMILQYHHLMVYPRKGYSSNELVEHPSVTVVEAPEIEVSSTFIRNAIGEGKDVRYFVPKEVYKYIIDMHFYEKKEK